MELSRLLRHLGRRKEKFKPSESSFRFGDVVFDSLGTVVLPFQTPRYEKPIPIDIDVVSVNVPDLLGLDGMDYHSLTLCTVTNTLIKRIIKNDKSIDLWRIKLVRADSKHLFAQLQMPQITRFSRVQLQKLHRQFFHPSTEKLSNLIKKARPEHATPETRQELEEITARCDYCQRIQNAPLRFPVSFGADNIRFNERILLDIMYIDGDPVLHIVDDGTHLSAAKFLPNIQADTMWKTILDSLTTIYTGLPHRILTDQGASFGEPFAHLCRVGGLKLERTGIEEHSSLNLGERYHQPLRNIFLNLMIDHPKTNKHLTLALSVKEMNDTLGPNGVVPSSLVFGEHPRVFTKSETMTKRPTLYERAHIAIEARQEMEKHMAQIRIKCALHHAVQSASKETYKHNDEVLLW